MVPPPQDLPFQPYIQIQTIYYTVIPGFWDVCGKPSLTFQVWQVETLVFLKSDNFILVDPRSKIQYFLGVLAQESWIRGSKISQEEYYIYIHMWIYIWIYTWLYIYIWLYMCMIICMYDHIIYMCMNIYLILYIYDFMYDYMYIYIYIYICAYIYIFMITHIL